MTKDKKFYSLANDSVFKNVFYRDDKLLKRFLTDILSIFYDDVDYYKNKWYNSSKSKEYYEQFKSIIMFGLTEYELKNLEDSDDYMKKIKDDVIKLNGDPNFYQAMTDEEDREMIENSIFISGKQEGIKQGIEQGTRRGLEENQKNIVKNMKDANYKLEDIKEITGLSIEEIEKI